MKQKKAPSLSSKAQDNKLEATERMKTNPYNLSKQSRIYGRHPRKKKGIKNER